jgi:hypothetical protein
MVAAKKRDTLQPEGLHTKVVRQTNSPRSAPRHSNNTGQKAVHDSYAASDIAARQTSDKTTNKQAQTS